MQAEIQAQIQIGKLFQIAPGLLIH